MKSLKLNNEKGFSILEVVIVSGIMLLMMMGSISITSTQNKQIKIMSQKVAINDVNNSVIRVMQNGPSCLNNLTTAINPSVTFDSTSGTPSISLNKIVAGTGASSQDVVVLNQEILPGSSIKPTSIVLKNLANAGGGKWTGSWEINLINESSGFVFKPIQLATQSFDVDLTVPTAARMTSCDAVVVTGGGGSSWDTSGADVHYNLGNVGIGTSTPSQKLEVVGNILLPVSTPTSGIYRQGSNSFIHTVGVQSSFFGVSAGPLTNTGSYNTALGHRAMASLSTGTINTASGHRALEAITTGSYNSSFGAGALDENTTGNGNSAFGANAMNNNVSGNENAYFGNDAGARTIGNYNTGVGYQAQFRNISGVENTVIGWNAGATNETGSYNTSIGANAGPTSNNLSNTVAIGRNALVSASNSMVLGGTGADGVNVGIGTPSPSSKLEVTGNSNSVLFQGSGYSLTGTSALPLMNLTGEWSTTGSPSLIKANITDTSSPASSKFLEFQTGGVTKFFIGKEGSVWGNSIYLQNNINNQRGIFILNQNLGANASATLEFSNGAFTPATIGVRSQTSPISPGAFFVDATNMHFGSGVGTTIDFSIGGQSRLFMNGAGNIGIGTVSPTQKLDVNGTLKVNDILYSSDRTLKHDIESLTSEEEIKKIRKLEPVRFKWNQSGLGDLGFIAQDMQLVFPELVYLNPDETYSVRLPSLLAPLVASIKNVDGRVIELERENAEMKQALKDLFSETKKLRSAIQDLEKKNSRAKKIAVEFKFKIVAVSERASLV